MIEIHWSAGSLDEARRVCRFLVQERFIACAQIVPWIESIYLWNEQLETAQESRVVLKTRLENFEQIKQIILKNSSYELPEITYIEIAGGNSEYLDWVAANSVPAATYKETKC